MSMIRLHLLWLLCLLSLAVAAQQDNEALSFAVSGEVRDNATGKKLENVNITAPQRHLATR